MVYLATSKPFKSGVIPSWAPRTNAERLADYVQRRYNQIEQPQACAVMLEKVRAILSSGTYPE